MAFYKIAFEVYNSILKYGFIK